MHVLRISALILGISLLSSCHIGRFFYWNFADANDHKKFASLPIQAPEKSFRFAETKLFHANLPSEISYKNKPLSFEDFLTKTQSLGFLVIRNDSILYRWENPKEERNRVIPSFSVAKSFVSVLIGIAIDQGKIKSVEEPITNYLKELDSSRFGKIRILDVLNMRSGIQYNESYFNPFGDVAKYYYGTNLRKYIKKQKIKTEPNKEFEYISLNTQLLGMIIERATGQSLEKYLEENLWTKMGMEFPASWSIDSKRHKEIKAFCCLNARMVDFAKLGKLMLNQGNWNGNQLVSREWVKQSTQAFPENYFVYSYQWWHTQAMLDSNQVQPNQAHYMINVRKPNGSLSRAAVVASGDYFAEGILGQYIYCYPEKNIIIVRMGKDYNFNHWPQLFKRIAQAN